MARKPKAAAEKSSASELHEHDSKETIDGCDIKFNDAEQTPDEDLPASTGGMA
jgi:hypothetical protein